MRLERSRVTVGSLKKQGFVDLLGAARKGEPGCRIPELQKEGMFWKMLGHHMSWKPQCLGKDPHSHERMETSSQAGGLAGENINTGYTTSAGPTSELCFA